MENLSAEQILSLVNLTLMDNEGIHYHYDPETQFYNQCHSSEDGRFCSEDGIVSGESELRDSDGKSAPVTGPVKRGKLGGSLVDPHEGTVEHDGLKGYHPETGKPVPGTDAWLEAHGLSRELWESRPYVRFEADKKDPALLEAFERGTPGAKQWDRLADQEGQEGGYIMYKHPIPDSPYGPISPQVRPNEGAITNYAERKQKEVRLEQAKQRYKDLKTKVTPAQLVKEQEAKVKKAELNLERTKKATPDIIRAEAKKEIEDASAAYTKAKASGDADEIAITKKALNSAKREDTKAQYRANKFKSDSAIYHAQKELDSAKQRLGEFKEDPKAALAAEIIRQGGTDGKGGRIKRAENAFKDTRAKYLFTRGADTARIDINPDKQNVKNLVEGKGRIYFAMEGSIKNDALLAAVKREDPTASVVNVPSVTLWHNKSAGEGEISWFSRTHGKDRQIVLVPDADGVNNVNVMRQANALASALKTHGAKQVFVAAPPVKHGTKQIIDPISLPSGAKDERKGIDDHLGAGRGTLGQLAYQTDAKLPKFSLAHRTREGGETGDKKLNRNGLTNTENMLGAISGLAGKNGAVQVSKNLLMQTSGITSAGSAIAARDKLQDLGIIDVKYVFDKDVLWNSRKRVQIMPQKEVDEWVKKKIIKPLPDDLYAKDDYEASPIIVIKDPKYVVKNENSRVGVLSDLDDWNPPKSYTGWRSPLTGKEDTTGIAARMASEEVKTKTKSKGPVASGSAKVSVVKTAKQRAATKKAPLGRRLVRTAEGAKRYGVKIGQPIPISALIAEAVADGIADALTSSILSSMVLLSSVMSEEDLIEFYNSCHDENGRFCETEGGNEEVVSGKFLGLGNSKIRTVADSGIIGSVTVDGIKAKAVYEATTKNGDVVKLYDKTGKADRYKKDLLNNHVKMHDLYPLQPPRNIVVVDPDDDNSPVKDHAFSTVYGNSPNTYVNSEWLGVDVKKFKDGFQMPSAKKGDTNNMDYLLTHEYGHHVDFSEHSNQGYSYDRHPLYDNPSFKQHLSRYGKSDARGVEGYAETFAEWHHTGGRTKNPAAIAMARYEGWIGAEGIRASGQSNEPSSNQTEEVVRLTLQNAIHLAKVESKATENEDMYSDNPKSRGMKITDTFTEDGPIVEGDFEIREPSEEAKVRANQIMSDVLKELGLKGNE